MSSLLNQPREELDRRGIPYTEAEFLRQVRNGNAEAVSLFLSAGVSPNATHDGQTALAASAWGGHKTVAKLLLDAGAEPLGFLQGLPQQQRDGWDKLASLAGIFTFFSSLVIAGVGWYFTSSYNDRQLQLAEFQGQVEKANQDYQNRLAEMQTVERMIPHLTKDESSKQAALIAISALASPQVASRLAEVYGGQGSIDALSQLASAGAGQAAAPAINALTKIAAREKDDPTQPAHEALAQVLRGRERAIVKVLVRGSPVCNGFVVEGRPGWVVTARFCVDNKLPDAALTVQSQQDAAAPVLGREYSRNGLLAFLKVQTETPTALRLAAKLAPVGATVTQIAFHLGPENPQGRGRLGVVLGRVSESGEMAFPDFVSEERKEIQARGLKVEMNVGDQRPHGTGGGPLLDAEGNVACLTFLSDGKGHEQCLSAEVIREAFAALQPVAQAP